MLGLLGLGMAAACFGMGPVGSSWPWGAVLGLAMLSRATAGGYTGVAYAEYARLGGVRRTEATGLGTAVMFAGVMILPSVFGAAVKASGGYQWPYWILAVLAAGCGLLLWRVGGLARRLRHRIRAVRGGDHRARQRRTWRGDPPGAANVA